MDGTLMVQGTTTTNSCIEDTLIMLNKGVETDINDSGILIERVGQNGFMGWDELHDTFIIGLTDATDKSTGNLAVTPTALTVGNFVANGDAEVTSNLTVKGNILHTGILNTSCGIFPTSIGTEGQVLTAGTNGVMEWAQLEGSGTGTIDPNEDLTLNKDLTVKGNILHTGILNTLGGIFPTSIGTEGHVLTAGTDGVMEWAQSEGSSTIDPNEDLTLNKDLTVKGTLICEGNTALGPLASTSLTVDHDATLGGDLLINGNNLTFGNGESMDNVTDGTLTLNANEVDIPGNLVVSGDFTVYRTTTTEVSVNTVDDPIITLGGAVDLTVDDNKDRGVEFRYFDSEAKRGFMGYDDSAEKFIMLTNATNNSEVFDGTTGTLIANIEGNVTGNASGTAATVTGAAQTAITSVGTLTGLQVDNVNIDGTTISSTGGTDLHIKPLTGQQLVLDDTIVIDAGVVTGATSITSTNFHGALTGNVNGNVTGNVTGSAATVTGAAQTDITSVGTLTGLDVNNININGTTISSTGGTDLNITPFGGQKLKLDNTIVIDAGEVTGATSITSTNFHGALTGNVNGNVTGNVTGSAATVTGAAQTAITSVGTLTELDVANININGTTISSTGGTDLNITPLADQQIVLDSTIIIDAGEVTGATSITSTDFYGDLEGNVIGNVTGTASGATTVTEAAQPNITSVGTLTGLDVDDININGTTISSTGGTDLNITPFDGQQIVLDSTIIIDAGVVTGATSITSTNFHGDVDGNVTGTAATVTGAAQTNITSVGTLTGLTVGSVSNYINIDSNTISATGATDLYISGEAGEAVSGNNNGTDGTDIVIIALKGGDSQGEADNEGQGGDGGDITLQAGDGGNRTFQSGQGGPGGDITLKAGEKGDGGSPNDGKITLNAPGRITTIGGLDIGDSSNSNEELRFYEGVNYVGFEAPVLSDDQIWVLPDADGADGDVLKTDGNGNLGWIAPGLATGPQTAITTIYHDDFIIGRDSDNQIDFTTDDNIFFKVGGTNQIQLENEVLKPITDNIVDLGSNDLQFKDVYINGVAHLDAIGFGTDDVILPTADGSDGQVLKTNGTGTLSWATFGGTSINELTDCKRVNNSIWIGSVPTTTTGIRNTALGTGALNATTVSGSYNVAIGGNALLGSTEMSGDYNTAVGTDSLLKNTSGDGNTALGRSSLYLNTTGEFNTAVGYESMKQNTTGDNNTAQGYLSLYYNTGSNNTALGYYAGYNITTGEENVIIGTLADVAGDDGTNGAVDYKDVNNQIVIGYAAISAGANTVTIGNASITDLYCNTQSITALSDKRIKKDVQESSIGLEFINQLRPVTYKRVNPADWSDSLLEHRFKGDEPDVRPADDDNVYDGLIAQEVESTLTALGATWSGHSINKSNGKQGLQYGALVMPLIKAVQELKSQNELLKDENEYIKQRLDALESS